MKTIELNVSYDKLFKDDEDVRAVEGSRNYTQIHFNFLTDDWNDVKMKVAYFEYDNGKTDAELVDTDNVVVIPSRVLALQYFKVSLKGYTETINQLIPTNKVDIVVDSTIEPNTDVPTENKYILRSFYEASEDNYVMKFLRNDGTTFELSLSNIKNDIDLKADPTKFDLTYDVDNGVVNLTYNSEVIGTVDFGEKLVLESATYDKNTKSIILKFTSGDIVTIPVSDLSDIYKGGTTETTTVTITDENEIKVEINEAYKVKKSDVENKVDKISGKGLSTNDFTNDLKTKLDGIESGANKTIVDESLSLTSTNPVQNKAVNAKLEDKVDKVTGKQLSTNDFTNELKNKLDGISDGATKVIVDSELSSTSENPVQNKVITSALDETTKELENYWSLVGEIIINENTDLNTLTTVGNYCCRANVTAPTLVNKPSDLVDAFVMKVYQTYGTANYVTQEIIALSKRYSRVFSIPGSAWTPWILINDIMTQYAKTSVVNNKLDKVTTSTGLPQAYVKKIDGSQVMWSMSKTPSIDVIALFDSNKNLKTSTPIADNDTTPKVYVDEKVNNVNTNVEDLTQELNELKEQLNGYLFDSTEVTLSDVDVAVIPKTVQVGSSTYNVADNSRAGVLEVQGKSAVAHVCNMIEVDGKSVKFNQLIDKTKFKDTIATQGITFTIDKTKGTITVNGTNTENSSLYFNPLAGSNSVASVNVINGHKYLLKGSPANASTTTTFANFYSDGIIYVVDTGLGAIAQATSNGLAYLQIIIAANATISNAIFTPQIYDLTAMGLDDISLTDFNKKFPNTPHEYNNGEVKHVEISEVTPRGLNMIDKSKIQYTSISAQGVTLTSNKDKGTVTINGTNSSSTQPIYFHLFTTSNKMHIVNGHKYLLKGAPSNASTSTAYLQLYGTNIITTSNNNTMSIGTAINTGIATIVVIIVAGATVSNMIFQPQLFDLTAYYGAGNEPTSVANVPFANDGKYHEYFSETLTLSSPLTLRGVDDVYCDKLYLQGDSLASGVVLRRFAEVDLGTLTWVVSENDKGINRYNSPNLGSIVKRPATNNDKAYILCSKYTEAPVSWCYSVEYDKVIAIAADGGLYISDKDYDNADTLKTSLSGVKLIYELATKTGENITTGGLSGNKEDIFNLLDTNANQSYDMIDREKVRYGKIKDCQFDTLEFKGKNLFNKNLTENIHKNTTISTSGELLSASYTTNALTLDLPYYSTTMTISFKKQVDTNNQTYGFNLYSAILDENKNVVETRKNISVGDTKATSFTITNINPSQMNKGYIRLAITSTYFTAGYELEDIQFEVGSTATSYSEYKNQQLITLADSAITLQSAKNAHDTIEVVKNESGLYDVSLVKRVGTYTFTGTENILGNTDNYPENSWYLEASQQWENAPKPATTNAILDIDSIQNTYFSNIKTLIFIVSASASHKNWKYEERLITKGAILNYELATPTTTSIATNLTLDEVTAIIEANGLVTVNGNSVNEAFAKPNVKLELVYKKLS